MTETDIRQLIDSYIVDNQAFGITPAKMRDMMQQTIDFILTEAGGGATTPTLDSVLTAGNTSNVPVWIGNQTTGPYTNIAPSLLAVAANISGAAKVVGRLDQAAGGGQGELALLGPGASGYHLLQAPNGATTDQVWKLPFRASGGTLEYQGRVTIDVAATAGNITTLDIVHGTAANGVTFGASGVKGYFAGILNAFLGFDASNSGILTLRSTGGTSNITLKAANTGTPQTLTLPAKTDTLATVGDTGVFYRLTITATGASSYTWGIPTLPFTPVMWFVQLGAPYGATSEIYGSGTTNTVTVNYVGAAPAAGTPLFFYFQIHG